MNTRTLARPARPLCVLSMLACQTDRALSSVGVRSAAVPRDSIVVGANIYSRPDMLGCGGVEVDAYRASAYAYTSTFLASAFVGLGGSDVLARSSRSPVFFALSCTACRSAEVQADDSCNSATSTTCMPMPTVANSVSKVDDAKRPLAGLTRRAYALSLPRDG